MRTLKSLAFLLLVVPSCSTPPEPPERGQAVAEFEDAVRRYRVGDLAGTEEATRRAIELEPGFIDARWLLGTVLERRGQPERAIAELQEILAIDPRFLPAGNQIGIILLELGRREEARAFFKACVDAAPGYVAALVNLGVMARADGRPEEAVRLLVQAAEAAPKHGNARSHLARALAEAGREDDAREQWRLALDCPNLTPADRREAERALAEQPSPPLDG